MGLIDQIPERPPEPTSPYNPQAAPNQPSRTGRLGKLHALINLDHTQHSHYGSEDPITGVISLTYQSQYNIFNKQKEIADLFGPLKIHTTLYGKIDIRVRRDNDLPTLHGGELLQKTDIAFDGSFKAEVGRTYQFPFSVNFPDGSKIATSPGYWQSIPLPPTFFAHFSHYPDIVDANVSYQLGVQVELPGIDVKTSVPKESVRPAVTFQLPRPPADLVGNNMGMFSTQTMVQSENLLPEDQRPQGFKQKAKAVFTSSHFPKLILDVSCTQYHFVCPELRPSFHVSVRRNDSDSTSPTSPLVVLVSFKVELLSYTEVDTSQRWRGKRACYDHQTIQTLPCQTTLPQALVKVNDYSLRLSMGPIAQWPCTFTHLKISRSYEFKITMLFKIAEESVKVKKQYAVIVVPPPVEQLRSEVAEVAEAGPSRPSAVQNGQSSIQRIEEEALPKYEDAVAARARAN